MNEDNSGPALWKSALNCRLEYESLDKSPEEGQEYLQLQERSLGHIEKITHQSNDGTLCRNSES